MTDRMKRIEEELEAELQRLDQALSTIDERRGVLLADRERVLGSLTALRPGKPVCAKRRGRPRRPCATQAEVAAAVQSLIEQNGPCPEDDLIGLAEGRLKDEGRSLSGFKLRFRAVRDTLLHENDGGLLTLHPSKPSGRPS